MLLAYRFNSFDLFGRVTGLCTQESKDFFDEFYIKMEFKFFTKHLKLLQ